MPLQGSKIRCVLVVIVELVYSPNVRSTWAICGYFMLIGSTRNLSKYIDNSKSISLQMPIKAYFEMMLKK